MSPFELLSIAAAARWAVTFTTLALTVVIARALRLRLRRGAGLLFGVFAVAAAFAHVPPLTATLPRLFPVGFALGLAAALGSVLHPRARRAFAALADNDVRLMLAFRSIYGALLLGLAGAQIMPPSFALTAGLGDLLVGWLGVAAPRSRDGVTPRGWRLLVHGLGLLDFAQVLALAVTVVRPWSALHHDVTDTMTLPWVAVPLMLALNLHGFWQACAARERELGSDGPEPVGRVRGALPGA
jgi:hypothetical protein